MRHAVASMLDGVEHDGKPVPVDDSRLLYAPGKDALPRINVLVSAAELADEPQTLQGRAAINATVVIAVLANDADVIDTILDRCGRVIADDPTLRGTAAGHAWTSFALVTPEDGDTAIVEGQHEYAVRFHADT